MPTSDTTGRRLVDRRAFLAATAGSSMMLAGCIGDDDDDVDPADDDDDDDVDPADDDDDDDDDDEPEERPFEGETLRTTVWSGPYTDRFDQTIKQWWEEETGATLELIPEWTEILANIRAAPEDNPPYDVTLADGFFYHEGRADDLFLEVRYENVPNFDDVFPHLQEFRDPTYGVPVDGDPLSIVYKDELDWEPETWADLLDAEDLNISLEGGFYVYPLQLAAIANDVDTGDSELYDPDLHDDVFDTIREINDANDIVSWYGTGAEAWEDMRIGEADVVQHYGPSSAWNAAEEFDMDLSVVTPEVTGGFINHFCVVRGTDNRDMAEHFLNFLLDAEIQSRWSEVSFEMRSNVNTEYPEEIQDLVPQTNEEWAAVNLPDWGALEDYGAELSERYEEIKVETS